MKHIDIPAPVTMVQIDDEPILVNGAKWIVTFQDFLWGRLIDVAYSTDGDAIDLKIETKKRVKAMPKRGVLELEDAQHKKLQTVCDNPHPTTGYRPDIVHNYQTFRAAVKNASSTPPKKKATTRKKTTTRKKKTARKR